jgi:hypothetical protein
MTDFPKPTQILRSHGGPFEGQSIDEIVQTAEGRAWLAGHIPSRPEKHQQIGLAWLSWALQREVGLDDLDGIASGEQS